MAVAQGVPTLVYYSPPTKSFTEWVLEVSDMVEPPLVMSISYSGNEDELTAAEMHQFNIG